MLEAGGDKRHPNTPHKYHHFEHLFQQNLVFGVFLFMPCSFTNIISPAKASQKGREGNIGYNSYIEHVLSIWE